MVKWDLGNIFHHVVVRNKTLHHGYKGLIKGYSNMCLIGTQMQLLSIMHKQILIQLYQFIVHTLLGDVAKFTLYFTRILSELGQIHYMKSW
jgi:hypothetical protein